MLHDEERLIRLKQQSSKRAIDLAMQGRWQEAVEVNKGILVQFPDDVDAYNRLGRACMELREYSQAKEAYHQALAIDPYNTIAKKNFQRLSHLKETVSPVCESCRVEPRSFIEEMGKAGVVHLYALAPKEVLAGTVAGNSVYLKIDGLNLTVVNGQGEYLGKIDPRHTQRLIKLMDGGNKYSAAVVSSGEGSVTVMIREVYQSPGQEGRLSFPPRGLEEVRPYTSDRVLKMETEQEDETAEEAGYTIIGGDGIEVLPEENNDIDAGGEYNED